MAVAIAQSQVSTIDHVSKTGAENSLVVAIDASRPVMPKARLLSEPDRTVIDFRDAVPSKQLRDIPLRGACVPCVLRNFRLSRS
jgi:hypothetical protein